MLKHIHMLAAALSISGFILRGIWALRDSPRMKARWVKIAPHIIDTVLLGSAILMAVKLGLSPHNQPWLAAKIVALLVYIGLGLVALRFGKTKIQKAVAGALAVLVFFYIVGVAVTRDALLFT